MSQAEISDAAAPLADATCRALFGLVLQCSALAADREPPADIIEAVRQLAKCDAALAAGLQPTGSQPTGSQLTGRGAVAADVDWGMAVRRLPDLLLHHFSSAASHSPLEDTLSVTAADGLQAQLLALCHVVLRQRTLEASFTAELNRQKTAAIYQFAYGLSHELNNPLANIATRAGLLASQESHPQRQKLLEAIVNHAMRGCEMLGDLMLVARPPKLSREQVQIDELISQLIARAQPWATPYQVTVRGQIDSQRSIEADPAALSEALWAVIRNAIEAMPDGGEIVISVSESQADLPGGRQSLCIEVTDQGLGLSAAALEHCFDPYYSGREAGRGLGLGLAKAQRIIDLHGGQLSLRNGPCGGCVARIVLPFCLQQLS